MKKTIIILCIVVGIISISSCKIPTELENTNYNEAFWGKWIEAIPCSNNPTVLTCDTFLFSSDGKLYRTSNNTNYTFNVFSQDSLVITSSIERSYRYILNENELTIIDFIVPIVGPPGIKHDIVLNKNK